MWIFLQLLQQLFLQRARLDLDDHTHSLARSRRRCVCTCSGMLLLTTETCVQESGQEISWTTSHQAMFQVVMHGSCLFDVDAVSTCSHDGPPLLMVGFHVFVVQVSVRQCVRFSHNPRLLSIRRNYVSMLEDAADGFGFGRGGGG